MVDHMLIKLGKYLRIAGYDAAWDKKLRTHDLINIANSEDRVFLTRNTRLSGQYPVPGRVLLITPTNPADQFSFVATALNLDVRKALFSRCIRCNVALEEAKDVETVRAKVHPNVFARYTRFYTCPSCGTIFWKGSHVRNTCVKLQLEDNSDL